jgi:hypothetical protein
MSDRSEDRTTHGRVSVGDILRSSDELTPPDVKASMRARVLASVVSEPSRVRAGRTYVVAATLVTVVLLCTAGVGVASSRSLPGGTFYPVKRALEQVRVIIAPAEGQADVYVDIADERIREVERLLNTGASARALNQAVDGFAEAAKGAVDVEVDEAAAQRRVEEILRHVDDAPPAVKEVIESALSGIQSAPSIAPDTAPPIPDVPSGQPEGGDPDGEEPAAPGSAPVPETYIPNESRGEGRFEPMALPGIDESESDANSL